MEMKRCCLRYPYLSVKTDNAYSYGGNQNWSGSRAVRRYGCGVVGMGDVILYLGLHQLSFDTDLFYGMAREDGYLSFPRYERYLRKISKRYVRIIPGMGVPGFLLPAAFNKYFRQYRIDLKAKWCVSQAKLLSRIERYVRIIPGMGVPGFLLPAAFNKYFRQYRIDLKAKWCVSQAKLLSRIEESLSRDIPVILSVGQNIPFWRKKKLCFYRQENGSYLPDTETKAHFVVVTGLENGYLQVSSWGREYYISWAEYRNYVKKYSSFLISNICLIEEKKARKKSTEG